MYDQHKKAMAEAKEYARKMHVVNLADKSDDKKNDDTENREERVSTAERGSSMMC